MIKLLGDRVAVKVDEAADQTESGLYVPDLFKRTPNTGTVVSVGPGNPASLVAISVKEGDKVIFDPNKASNIVIADQQLFVMSESDIIGVL
jgi:chaperonin GroES